MKAEELNPKDLRIGNILREKYTGHILVVSELTKNRITFDYQTIDKWQAEPIPLSEDVLLKCGFEYYKGNNSYQLDSNLGFTIWGRVDSCFNVFVDDVEFGETIHSLHQLQNVYYSLTREELEVSL